MKTKYCETLKPGYYLIDDEFTSIKRCIYASGAIKGNKWIDLNVPNPQWMILMWNCVFEYDINMSVYFKNNPTNYN